MAAKKPKPELITIFEEAIWLFRMEFDRGGKRILATDREGGALYVVNLTSGPAIPRRLASDLGPVTEIDLSRDDPSLLLLNPSERKIFRIECRRGSEIGLTTRRAGF